MVAATTIRLPRARLLIETAAASGIMKDLGRVEEANVALNGEPSIVQDFDPDNCVKYEASRSYLDLRGVLTANLVNGEAKSVAEGLLSTLQTVAADTGLTYASPAGIAVGDLLDIGWSPAGSASGGVFTPSALTTAEDDAGTPNSLVLDTDYEWYDGRNGIIKVLNISGLTPPFNFTGDSRATERAVLGDGQGVKRRVDLIGVDERNSCTGEVVRLWITTVQPSSEVMLSQALDSDEGVINGLVLDILPDTSSAATSTLGKLGYWDRG